MDSIVHGVLQARMLEWVALPFSRGPSQPRDSAQASCIAGGFYLNQIPYEYTVEVTNRCKGLDLIDRVPEELWTEVHDTVQEAVIKIIPKKKKSKIVV